MGAKSNVAAIVAIAVLLALDSFPGSLRNTYAQESGPETALEETSDALRQKIAAHRKALSDAPIEEEAKNALAAKCADIDKILDQAKEWLKKARAYEKARLAAPSMLEGVDTTPLLADSVPGVPSPELPADRVEKTMADLKQARQEHLVRQKAINDQLDARARRRVELPKDLEETKKRLEAVVNELSDAPKGTGPADADAIAHTLLEANRLSSEAALLALQREGPRDEAEANLLRKRLDRSAEALSAIDERIKATQSLLDSARQREADAAAQAAAQAAQAKWDAHPSIRQVAQRVEDLARRRAGPTGLVARLNEVEAELARAKADLTELETDFKDVRKRVETVGLTAALGAFLRKRKAEFSGNSVAGRRRAIRLRQEEITRIQWELMEREERRADLFDLVSLRDGILVSLDPPVPEEKRPALASDLTDRLQAERDLLDEVIDDLDRLFNRLIDLDTAERRLVAVTGEYTAYIDERILWVRSTASLSAADGSRAAEALTDVFDPDGWRGVGNSLASDIKRSPVMFFVGLVLCLLLVALSAWLGSRMSKGNLGAKETYVAVIEVFLASALIAASVPVLLFFLAWRLGDAPEVDGFSRAVAGGLRAAGWLVLSLGMLRQLARPGGLARVHFKWPLPAMSFLSRATGWLTLLLVLPVTLDALSAAASHELARDALGKTAFMVTAVLVSACLGVILRPRGGLLGPFLERRQDGWFYRLRNLWMVIGVAAPLGLTALAGAGYVYTARDLGSRFLATGGLLVLALVAYHVVFRWFFLFRKRLAQHQSALKKECDGAAPAATENSPAVTPAEDRSASQRLEAPCTPGGDVGHHHEETDLRKIREQTLKILRLATLFALVLGLWAIWADAVPALSGLDRVELWSVKSTVSEQVASPDGTDDLRTVDKIIPITLADLGLALLLVILTFVAIRNLPPLFEVVLLKRIPMTRGSRYALRTIFLYLVAVTGAILALGTIGFRWSSVQWLVAAMTVGLAFGLQEIFANFISGLIMLLERPVRVGDTVTVGGVSGTVSRIRMRATTITDWDRKELVVPNKEFITGQIINWTLSDNVLRVIIPVGVAYGSDVKRARDELLRVAKAHPDVLDDPEPKALFLSFGASSLDFELRVFVPALSKMLAVKDDLHMAVDAAFREANIEIAFPQQDIHIRSVDVPFQVTENQEPETRNS